MVCGFTYLEIGPISDFLVVDDLVDDDTYAELVEVNDDHGGQPREQHDIDQRLWVDGSE
jgi:hypothetical protein